MTAFEDDTAINDFTRQIPEKIGTLITSGSFGKVYRCSIKTTKGDVEVAVKVFVRDPSNLKAVEAFEKRICRELKVWLRLKHPTIVPLLGIAYVDPPLPALVSQWMSSGTLYIYLKEVTDIAVSTKVGLAKGVVDGLNYLHSENVIHGDLHPENVLIDGSGNPCLTDFGLATIEGEAELQLNTTTAERSFNPRWRAPEVIGIERGPERPNFKSDIYSFGGVMFFILSGDRPWKEKNSTQIYIALSNKTVHTRPENILDDQWNLIRQCWSWEPGNRPSAADILVSIDQSKRADLHVPVSRQSIARQRLKEAVRFIITMQKQQAGQTPLYSKLAIPPRTPSFDQSPNVGMLNTIRERRNSMFIPKLRTLGPLEDFSIHSALVRHMQFSPNGRYLATSSWDRSSVIFRVGEPFSIQAVLVDVRGFIVQVAWSATSTILLTRLLRGIKVWTEHGLCKRTIDRPHSVSSIAWLPNSETQFFSAEGSNVFKLDIQGKVLESYHFDCIQLHSVAVTPDGQRLLAVGSLLVVHDRLHPSHTTRVEKRIIVFNIETSTFESQTPIVNEVRDITISRRGGNVLISFKSKTPPQLWKMELVRDMKGCEPHAQVARPHFRHTYLPKAQVNFASSSYFGGKEDQLVLCAGKAGDVHIWDRDSAALLHYIEPQTFGGVLTCVAWNHFTDEPFIFATGSHDGMVHIWTTPASCREHKLLQNTREGHQKMVAQKAPTLTSSLLRKRIPYDPLMVRNKTVNLRRRFQRQYSGSPQPQEPNIRESTSSSPPGGALAVEAQRVVGQEDQPSASEEVNLCRVNLLNVLNDLMKTGKDDDSRFWMAYKRVAEKHDNACFKRYIDVMDTVISLSGLFSSFNSAFIVEMKSNLTPDPDDTTPMLLIQVIQIGLNSFTAAESMPVALSTVCMRLQYLAYVTLSLSLLITFGAILSKELIIRRRHRHHRHSS